MSRKSQLCHRRSSRRANRICIEPLEARLLPATYIVGSPGSAGDDPTLPGSLEAAIETANKTPGLDRIEFNFPGLGPFIIHPRNMPAITDPLIIDGTSQNGYRPDRPVVVIDASGLQTATAAGPGIFNIYGGGTTIRGLTIRDSNANRFG